MSEVFATGRAALPASDRRGGDRLGIAHVLIVEDSATARRILRNSLEAAGYRVTEARHGAEALELMRRDGTPDLVLLDLEMPVMDGRTLLANMRSPGHEDLNTVPAVVLTAVSGGGNVADLFAIGAQDYVRKPCDPPELQARVAATLARAGHERRLRESIDRAEQLSTTDGLTGLGNRRALLRRVEELQGEHGALAPIGVMLVDVDHFKRINDGEGHHVGDAVLRMLARRLAGAIDPADLLVRWGGEEFLILAEGRGHAGTRALAHRVHAAVADSPVAVEDDREPLSVTVSVGCSAGRLEELDALVGVADQALYEAKDTGRDRVVHRIPAQASSGTSHSPPSGGSVTSAE